MTVRRAIALLLFLTASAACGNEARAERVMLARVVGVQDGDTITVLDASRVQHRIRLAGIDAPERHQPFGSASRRALSDVVFGRDVELRVTKTDRYERLVAKVLVGKSDVCLAQLQHGMAWFYADYQDELSAADRAAYAAGARDARNARRGLWADANPVPPWRFRREGRERSSSDKPAAQAPVAGKIVANRNSGIFHTPECPDGAKVSPRNRVYFDSESAATAAGYRKARNCG